MSGIVLDVGRLKTIGGLSESHHIDCVMLTHDQASFPLRLITDNDEYLELEALSDALEGALK